MENDLFDKSYEENLKCVKTPSVKDTLSKDEVKRHIRFSIFQGAMKGLPPVVLSHHTQGKDNHVKYIVDNDDGSITLSYNGVSKKVANDFENEIGAFCKATKVFKSGNDVSYLSGDSGQPAHFICHCLKEKFGMKMGVNKASTNLGDDKLEFV